SPARMRPWSTRRTASPPEGDRLAPFGSPAGGLDPQVQHRGHPRSPLECHGSQAATGPQEPPVSPRKAGKPTDAATLARRAAHSPPTPGGDHAPVQDGDG